MFFPDNYTSAISDELRKRLE